MFIGGAVVQWLRDGLGLIAKAPDVERLAASVADNGGVYLVPAFAGLGRAALGSVRPRLMVGITRGTTSGHVARAALESIAYQVDDLLDAVSRDSGITLGELRVDGGASTNNALLQFQADLLGVPVVRPAVTGDDRARRGLSCGPRGRVLVVGRRDRGAVAGGSQVRARHGASGRRTAARALARGGQPIEGLDSRGPGGMTLPVGLSRADMLARLEQHQGAWDFVVIGGGATGAGVAVDAASRGYSVLLLEQSDFGKGTSSRSTKLVHGGVRYLEQGNISLVMEALKERGILRQNAPHLVSNLPFVVPNYDWWETPFYGIGLKVYNLLAGKYGFGDSSILSREETLAQAADDQDGRPARRRRLLRRPVRRLAAPHQPRADRG